MATEPLNSYTPREIVLGEVVATTLWGITTILVLVLLAWSLQPADLL